MVRQLACMCMLDMSTYSLSLSELSTTKMMASASAKYFSHKLLYRLAPDMSITVRFKPLQYVHQASLLSEDQGPGSEEPWH